MHMYLDLSDFYEAPTTQLKTNVLKVLAILHCFFLFVIEDIILKLSHNMKKQIFNAAR